MIILFMIIYDYLIIYLYIHEKNDFAKISKNLTKSEQIFL